MKFVTYSVGSGEIPGILSLDMQSVHPLADAGISCPTLLAFIQGHTPGEMASLRELAGKIGVSVAEVQLLAPIPRPHHDIICLGLNYMDHVKESASFNIDTDGARDEAVYFSKRATRAIGPDGEIHSHSDIGESRLDYEAELAVVIDKDAYKVAESDAWAHVFGLACFNDITARDLQHKHKQWFFGKSLDTFTAFGPYIATLDEFSLPLNLRVCSRVNGEERQSSNTSNMIFTVPYVISELSGGMTLDAGSIITTGTPAGVGAGVTPPRTMQPGDVCEIEIEGCGVLRNVVV